MKKLLPSIMITSLLLPSFFFIIPTPVEAGFEDILGRAGLSAVGGAATGIPVSDALTHFQNNITNTSVVALAGKENVLDRIGWIVSKQVIRQITTSIVEWIDSGFEGNPAFITDPQSFFIGLADQVSGVYIKELGLENRLCSPFSLEIRSALMARRNRKNQRLQCTLSTVVGNIQGFLDDFNQGGWPAWLSLIQEENNPYMRYLAEEENLARLIEDEKNNKTLELNWGRGFLSKKDEFGDIVTPGVVIENQLNSVLGSNLRQLELADEFDEIVSALLNQLVTRAITGTAGLLGTNRAGSDQNGSYLDSLANEIDPGQAVAKESLLGILEDDIALEKSYINAKEASARELINAKQELNSLIACFETKRIGQPGTQAQIETASSTINIRIKPSLEAIEKDILVSSSFSRELQNLEQKVSETDNINIMRSIANQYRDIKPTLHTLLDLGLARDQADAIQGEMTSIVADTRLKLTKCQSNI